jgi:hypothetical protein
LPSNPLDEARATLERAYAADVAALADRAARAIRADHLSGEAAAEAVFDVVAASARCRNVGQALETLLFSSHDRAVLGKHEPDCGCLDWSGPGVWCHFAAHALAADVTEVLAEKYGLTVVSTRGFGPHGSPDGLVS